jgi:AcrR family transcriptional regulator
VRTADVEDGQPRPSRRERVRATTVEEIKATALELIEQHGTAGLRFSDIAAEMGFTAPALYRYFADRDELLTALVTDSYAGLTAALTAARDACTDDVDDRLRAACVAYRGWALANPQRFALIFGAPVPGYAAPPDGPTLEAGRSTMAHIAELFADADRVGRRRAVPPADPAAAGECELPPETMDAVLLTWSTVHGFVSLETYGHFHALDQQARDRLFEVQVRNAAATAGLTPPPPPGPGAGEPGTPRAERIGRRRSW